MAACVNTCTVMTGLKWKITLLNVFITLLFVTRCTAAHRLNVPRVLLPVFSQFPVNFTLEVTDGGCYKWSTSRLDIIELIPVNEDIEQSCSSIVVIRTITRELVRNTAIVLAEDTNTGQFLRCDVITDAIFSLSLVTTTRELYIEEAPEAFEVRAYDDQGNEFTTLAGIEFTWTIRSADERSDKKALNDVLRFISYQDSHYETPSTVAMLDAIGKKGHIVLLEGSKTGTAKVSVRLPYSEYKDVPAIETELIVIANLIIVPSDVTLMVYDSLKYKIMQAQQGRLKDISLPSSQYYLEAEHKDIVQIDNDRCLVYASLRGRTKIFLHDRNVREEYPVVLPSATINVQFVSYITLAVLPSRNKELILGHTHDIIVELFSDKDHRFHIGDGVEVSTKIDERYFDIKSMTRNGTYIVGVPIACGTMVIEATLHAIIDHKGNRIHIESKPSTKAEFLIHTPVIIQPKTLIVPWDSKSRARYDVALKASGGDGLYTWTVGQPSIATISRNGDLKILSPGSTEISVAMSKNQLNKDTAKVHVLVPFKLKIIEYDVEAAIGESIHLHVALYGKLINGTEIKEVPFDDCKDIKLVAHIPSENFIRNYSNNVQPVSIACTVVTITSVDAGVAEVTIAYETDGMYISDNATVSSYEPLLAIHPESKETLLAVGSSQKIIFKGGPRPSSTRSRNYSRKVQVSDEEIVRVVEQERTLDLFVVEATCQSLGESLLTYVISNIPILPNCKSTYATETVKVICGKPRYIQLRPKFKDTNNCPIAKSTEKAMAHSDEKLKIAITIKDEDGKHFDNFTSLNIEWNLKPSSAGYVEVPGGSIEETWTLDGTNVVLSKDHYQNIFFEKHFGTLSITATVTGYRKQILAKLKITPEWPPFPVETIRDTLETPIIKTSVEIELVNDTVISPNKLTILNDPGGKYVLKVSQGSGYYEFRLTSDEIADVRYAEPTKTIIIVPKKAGVLDIALVDLCLPSKPALATVEVQELAAIEVEAVNKVEKGKCILATLRLYDANGRTIKLPSLEDDTTLRLKGEVENSFIEIKQQPASEHGVPPYDKLLYTIHGIEEGEDRLSFVEEGLESGNIRSEAMVVQVFSPLKVEPKNLTVPIASIYQIRISGGPSNAEIEFSSNDGEILRVDRQRGILEAKSIGQTKIIARAIGVDSKGNEVIYSEDYADIRVVFLEGVKIVAPTNRVKVGAVLPFWAFGIPEYLTPLVIGSMQSPLTFAWSSSDPNLLSLHNMYEGTGINIRYRNEVCLRARAIGAGIATVYLNVTMPCNALYGFKNDVTYTASFKIEIFEELRLVNLGMKDVVTQIILMSPNSILKLRTNRDEHGSTIYKILSSVHNGNDSEDTRVHDSRGPCVSVDKNGVIKSGNNLGRTIISITNTEMYNFKRSLIVVVEVKPIHYIMLSLESNLRIRHGEELNMLPKGMELNYAVEYYDNVGTKFHAAQSNFKSTSNRVDLASFTKSSQNLIIAKFIENGELVLKIFDEKHPAAMFDYVHMIIGEILFPTKTVLTIGDIVCFSMPLLSSDGDPGYWQSSAPDVLTVDPVTGIARARNVGRTIVKHSLATRMQGEIEVEVQPISKISIVPLRGKNITGMEVFSVPLVLKSKDERIKENNILARGLGGCRTYTSFSLSSFPYTCDIQFVSALSSIGIKDLFIVKPRFDIVTGFYYCDVIPMGSPTILSSIIETRVRISARCRDIETTPLEVSYLPPMYVNAKEIVFADSRSQTVMSTTLDIYGLHPVLEHLTVDVPEGITIVGRQYASKSIIQYRLRLTHDKDELQGRKVIIANELTKQNISLVVRVSTYDQFLPLSGIQWVDYMYFHRYTFGTFAIVVMTFYYIWKNKVTNIDVTVKNKSVFADKCTPPLKKSSAPCSPITPLNTSTASRSPNSSSRQFSAFQPVYGDPRRIYTPIFRRNRTLNDL